MFALRALNGYLTVVVRTVLQVDVEAFGMLLHPSPVFVDVRGVDHEEEVILAHFIHQQVVDRTAVFIAHHTIVDFPNRRPSHIVRKDMLHVALCIWTLHSHLAHVRYIEESHMFSDGHVLRGNACILVKQRHIEASELDHCGTQRQVLVEQARALHFLF